jgi:hypothetical protein
VLEFGGDDALVVYAGCFVKPRPVPRTHQPGAALAPWAPNARPSARRLASLNHIDDATPPHPPRRQPG